MILSKVNIGTFKVVEVERECFYIDKSLLLHGRDIICSSVDRCIAELEDIESSSQTQDAIYRLLETYLLLDCKVFEITDTGAQLNACNVGVDVSFEERSTVGPLNKVFTDFLTLSGVILISFTILTIDVLNH